MIIFVLGKLGSFDNLRALHIMLHIAGFLFDSLTSLLTNGVLETVKLVRKSIIENTIIEYKKKKLQMVSSSLQFKTEILYCDGLILKV